jgi:predicted site-specific integrase-resolvase
MSEYLNTRQAAGILGVSHETLRFWRYTGKHTDKIPAHKHISRKVFYKRADVMSFSETMYCPA